MVEGVKIEDLFIALHKVVSDGYKYIDIKIENENTLIIKGVEGLYENSLDLNDLAI